MEESTNTINPISDLPEANSLRRNAAGIIDAAIAMFLFIGIAFYLPQLLWNKLQVSIGMLFYILLTLIIHRLISIVFLKQTLGMRLSNIQLLNEYDDTLSIKEGIFAAFFILINGIAYYKLDTK
jgi:NhaP-type Na+/H+ or K+/H+ antiporter